MPSDIDFSVSDGIGVATLSRESSLNAFRADTRAQLATILADVARDPTILGLVITGRGRAFSSGQDLIELDELLADPDYLQDGAAAHVEELQQLSLALLALEKPVVAALNGVAVGLGAELALACDIRVASTAASIGFVESTRGLFETNGVIYLLPRMVGYSHAMDLMLTGEIVDARRAAAIGLVTRVVAPEALMDEAVSLARRLAANAPITTRLIKSAMQKTFDLDLITAMQVEVDGVMECLRSRDLRQGVSSFRAGVRPEFNGD